MNGYKEFSFLKNFGVFGRTPVEVSIHQPVGYGRHSDMFVK